MSIFVIMTSVILFNQNKFSSDTALTGVTYELALQVRQAQVYGILVRQTTPTTPVFDVGYGIHLEKNVSTGIISLVLFSDNNNSGTYDLAGGDTIVSPFNMREGNIIKDVCTTDNSIVTPVVKCFSKSEATTTDVVFKRPDPSASIIDSSDLSKKKNLVDITISSALGDKTKTVEVRNTGQISVK